MDCLFYCINTILLSYGSSRFSQRNTTKFQPYTSGYKRAFSSVRSCNLQAGATLQHEYLSTRHDYIYLVIVESLLYHSPVNSLCANQPRPNPLPTNQILSAPSKHREKRTRKTETPTKRVTKYPAY